MGRDHRLAKEKPKGVVPPEIRITVDNSRSREMTLETDQKMCADIRELDVVMITNVMTSLHSWPRRVNVVESPVNGDLRKRRIPRRKS